VFQFPDVGSTTKLTSSQPTITTTTTTTTTTTATTTTHLDLHQDNSKNGKLFGDCPG
jgi:hypothetical protein